MSFDLKDARGLQAIISLLNRLFTLYSFPLLSLSHSIRANQQAETLQAQHALLLQQRDELLAKLGQCEDRELKQQAALTNLQCALEQFQNGE